MMDTIRKNLLSFCFILIGYTYIYAQNTIVPKNDSSIYASPIIQVRPKFNGDIKEYLADSIRYPKEAREKNIQGTVFVYCIIEKDGSISNIKVLRSPDISLSNEAKRVVSTMPKWKPGMENGVPQRVQYSIPVEFKL